MTRLEKKTFRGYAGSRSPRFINNPMKGIYVIRKIISGGQGPAELAALDLAIKLEIPHKGWTPQGGEPEREAKYQLTVETSGNQAVCMEKNIQDAQGVLVLCPKKNHKTFQLLKKLVNQYNKDFFMVELEKISKFECALNISRWVSENRIEVLYVTGTATRKEKPMYETVLDILETVLYLNQVETSKPITGKPSKPIQPPPRTVEEAVEYLISELPLKDRVVIAHMTFGELGVLNLTLGKYIRDSFGLWSGNDSLVNSCNGRGGAKILLNEEVPMVIIQALWETLKPSHRLRVVK
ncbi:MAG: hypothetical protein FP816_08160 [Desulfobacteraceae bacterium]|nr:hypothetical protein [Desulfobacteraceae bacterium]